MKPLIKLGFVLGLYFLWGCTSTRITSSWKASDVESRSFNKIMVVGIIREADRSINENMEQHIVDDLRKLGYQASSAFRELGPKAFTNMNEEEVKAKLAGKGVDGVITVVLLDKQKERYYVPGRVTYTPYMTYHNRFWGYYRSIYARIEEPGYYDESTRYFWESNFYDLRTNTLLYSVQTQSFDPATTENLAHEYGKKIVEDMVKNKVIGTQEVKTDKEKEVVRGF